MRLPRLVVPFLVLLCAAPVWGRSGQAYIDAVTLRRGGRSELQVGFRVQRAFDGHLLDTLDSGLPIRFAYTIQVVRRREMLPDQVVSEARLDRTLSKDNLKNRYVVSLGAATEQRDVATLAEAQELMSRIDGARVIVPEGAARSGPYVLKIKAKLQQFRLPFHLHYLFAFVSYWDVDTDWYAVELPRNLDALP